VSPSTEKTNPGGGPQTRDVVVQNRYGIHARPAALLVKAEEEGDLKLVINLRPEELKRIKGDSVKQNITTLHNRVNELGVAEPIIQQQGEDRIVVQLPGVQDTAKAKDILGRTASLEVRLVEDDMTKVQEALGGVVPMGYELLDEPVRNGQSQKILLKKEVELTGDNINDAQAGFDENGGAAVHINLDSAGAAIFKQVTRDNIGKRMGVVFIENKTETKRINGELKKTAYTVEEVINVATIQSRLGSQFRITGIDNANEAHNLALLLRAGALIAPIQIVEERTIGPSLGQQNIDSGMEAIGWAMLVIVLFMGIYYRAFGWVANLALTMNLVLIVGIMSMIPGATMTLPGIAGIVLTLGMAVDANVLIYERIREEIRNGRGVQQAIHLGFDRAFSTIADSNITSLITCVILFGIGTGAIKGFALTLGIGLTASMFTAITVSRAIINLAWGGRRIDKLPI
jgi:preprotein translocase subunit SecD